MARYGRRGYRRYRRYGRRRYRGRVSRRRYRRRISRTTRSSAVKLTLESDWKAMDFTGNASKASPFSFGVSALQGFSQYAAVYSEFRILKTRLYIHRTAGVENLPNSYLVVSSQPFADSSSPQTLQTPSVPVGVIPPQVEDSLRQCRWQRLVYPSATRTVTKISFRPYTMRYGLGPVVSAEAATSGGPFWPKRYDARHWMPFTWAQNSLSATGRSALQFYGPYVWVNTPTGGDPTSGTLRVTLECYCQFRGQR